MTHYMHDGVRYSVAPSGALDITEILPLGTYKVGYIDQADTFYLERIADFTGVDKVYGKTLAYRDRILRTFHERDASTGVLLSGEKGGGKTLLAKLLCLEAQETGVPTIVINHPWRGDTFNSFIQSIEQPAVVLFDEFEKVYDREQQEKLLTLLDGTYTSKKLFLLTANDQYKINDHMINRPGRVFYRINFTGLDAEFVREYCNDNLSAGSRVGDVVRVSMMFSRFNFDILKALVEEMNRYDEAPEQALELLNAKPELGEKRTYTLTLTDRGKELRLVDMGRGGNTWRGNPLTDDVQVWYQPASPEAKRDVLGELMEVPFDPLIDDDEDRHKMVHFRAVDLKRVDIVTGEFTFQVGTIEASLVEQIRSGINYSLVY